MKFKGYGKVWDKEKNRTLIEFPKKMVKEFEDLDVAQENPVKRKEHRYSIVEVEDEYIINKLIALGYEPIETEEDVRERMKREIEEELKNKKNR